MTRRPFGSPLRRLRAIDIFCGVGGMSLGFEQAGFELAGAVDLNPINVESHRINFPVTPALVGDVAQLRGSELKRRLAVHGPIDVVFGGPPCQGFSVGGIRTVGDERNVLFVEFARLLAELAPRYFVIENVPGLLDRRYSKVLKSSFSLLDDAGYSVVTPIQMLDAADFGVPQRRNRVFVLGYRRDLIPPQYPNLSEFGTPGNTVWSAISDLAIVDAHPHLVEDGVFTGRLGRPTPYAAIMRGDVTDPHNKSNRRYPAIDRLTGFRFTRHSRETVKRFNCLAEGKRDPVSRFLRLDRRSVAPTLRAGTGPERGSFMAPRPVHPLQPRCILLREAARLHSFPDWFQFHSTSWHGFMQIGNSVPPFMARAVALALRQTILRNT